MEVRFISFLIERRILKNILNDKGQLKVLKFLLNNNISICTFRSYNELAKEIGFKSKSGVWKAINKLHKNGIIKIASDKFYQVNRIHLMDSVTISNDEL